MGAGRPPAVGFRRLVQAHSEIGVFDMSVTALV